MNGLFLALVLTAYAPQMASGELLPPEQEARAQKLGKELRCAVCQGLSITDSPAQMARSQLDKVRELIKECKSDEEIKTYFVARYGEWALLRPRAEGLNWLAWAGPVVLLVVGGGVIASLLRKSTNAQATPSPAVAADAAAASQAAAPVDPYLERVRRELDG